MRKHRWLMALGAMTAIAALAFAAAACGDDDDDDDGDDAGGADLVAANVNCKDLGLTAPKRIKDAGKLVVGSDLSYAPIDFTKEGTSTPIGLDADIANCIAQAWGVKADIQNTSFDAIIPSLTGKKIDLIMSAMSVTEERQKEINFVPYFTAGSGILVKKGNPDKIASIADLCGKTVSIQVGTVQIDEAEEQNAKCKEKIKVSKFEQNTDAIQEVASGRAAASLMDYPVAAYNAKKVKGTEVVGEQYNTGPYGIGVRKDDAEVKDALDKALKAMMEKGQYAAILKYWDLEAGALK
ncbi:MAG: ABC transporter substrate-binding protein [Thermoflexaceae bacterium]|nr:ABC transporter substrate-binding protein [Thermoflexaceae bacterium]